MLDLSGRIVLVPGANGVIGSQIARYFAECGADVAMTYHSHLDNAQAALDYARALGRRARIDQLDAGDLEAVKALVASVIAEFGRIDVLASGVGGQRGGRGFELFTEQSPEEWKGSIGTLMAIVNLCYAVVGHMIERGSGRILAIGSDAGKVGQSGGVIRSAWHGGLIAFAKALAREVGRSGVTVNVVCPGPTEGPTLDRLRSGGTTGAKIVEEMIRRIPMKRPGTPREVAATMAFLASEDGGYITGQAISASGGLTMN